MKNAALLVIAFLLGCNPKVKIVEKEKDIKFQILVLQYRVDSLEKVEKNRRKENPYDTSGFQSYKEVIMNLDHTIDSLQAEYNHWETELKKY